MLFDPRARARLRRSRAARAGAVLVTALIAFALIVPAVTGHDPNASDFVHGLDPDTGLAVGPNARYWLGTDRLFRDQLTRLALGARLSIAIALAATAIASTLGAAVGIVAGYYQGSPGIRVPWPLLAALATALAVLVATGAWRGPLAVVGAGVVVVGAAAKSGRASLLAGPRVNVDDALMRAVDVGLSFPFLLLVMAIGTALDRATSTSILLVLGLTGWLGTARLLRAKTLQVRSLEYVEASRALGERTVRILLRHVLPSVAGPWIVISTVAIAQMILAESVLSYLGGSVAPPTPTWGRMLFEAQDYVAAAPWLAIAPGAAILLAVLGFNLLGEGLRDALDPREA